MAKTRHTNKRLRKLCDCPRRGWAKCSHAWYFNFKPRGGKAYAFSLDKHLGKHIDNKTDAETEAGLLRIAIRAGTFGQATPRDEMTLRQLTTTYLDRYVKTTRPTSENAFTWKLDTICRTVIPRPTGGSAAMGEWRLTDIVTDTIERFREVRRAQGTGIVGVNRYLGSLRAVFNWAVRTG